MNIPVKRYYTIAEVSVMIGRSYPMTKSLIYGFGIPMSKHAVKGHFGRVHVIDARDIDHLKNCAQVMTHCRKLDWVGKLPKYIIKDLISRL